MSQVAPSKRPPGITVLGDYILNEGVTRRLRVVAASGAQGVWLNRYGYLSDEKSSAVGQIWRASA